ncbi:putative glycolipid-binding domain-containing protein [Williamsia sp.]|uniref:putative glycolipid-binding domain-containing protein n=1 Tax=Williamsia sp. TaxID=1872085 RepID=UPI001A186E8E|nr:putative glycolipid-binding domain-containing protein [Williamsia sp.]MBJ7291406.1 putative glycolipid-binding domain-containing protein [Williamsia sp.]
MSSPQDPQPRGSVPAGGTARSAQTANDATDDFKSVLTWRGANQTRLEQARVQVSGNRIKAYGQIIGAATDEHEAFSATYDLLTNDAGITRRLAVHLIRASGETQISITRDGENTWLVQTPQGMERGDFGGAEDVDLALSPLFNALPIRRHNLHREPGEVEVPVVYLYLPEATVTAATVHYTATTDAITVVSPVSNGATITVDSTGFVQDYSGLADRV